MGRRSINYLPLTNAFFFFYMALIFVTIVPLMKYVFTQILGIPFYVIEALIILSILGSTINIPLFTLKSERPVLAPRIVSFMGVPWVVPDIEVIEEKTIIAVNFGGCIVPVALSIYIIVRMINKFGNSMLILILFAIVIDSILIYSVSRPIPGVGIATPAVLPPLFTALITIFTVPPIYPPEIYFAFSYSVGTLSALIGADILNLPKIPKLGAPIASIGGAGTFDGIYLTGLLSMLFLI